MDIPRAIFRILAVTRWVNRRLTESRGIPVARSDRRDVWRRRGCFMPARRRRSFVTAGTACRGRLINFQTTSVSACREPAAGAIVVPAIRSRAKSTGRPPSRGQFELCRPLWQRGNTRFCEGRPKGTVESWTEG